MLDGSVDRIPSPTGLFPHCVLPFLYEPAKHGGNAVRKFHTATVLVPTTGSSVPLFDSRAVFAECPARQPNVLVIGLVCSEVYYSIHVCQFLVIRHNAAHSPHLSHTSLSPFSAARTLGLSCSVRDKIRNSSSMWKCSTYSVLRLKNTSSRLHQDLNGSTEIDSLQTEMYEFEETVVVSTLTGSVRTISLVR